MSTERDSGVEDVELRAALREHFSSEVDEIGRTSAPPERIVEGLRNRESRSPPRRWVLVAAAAAVFVVLGTAAWVLTRTELPRARTLRAIEQYLAGSDGRLVLELEAFAPFPNRVNSPSPSTTYIVQWDATSRYRIGRRNESGETASSAPTFDVVPPIAGFDGTSSWYFSGVAVNIADGDITGEGDVADLARFIATGLVRQVRDAPESIIFDEGEASNSSTRHFVLRPRDPGRQAGPIAWERCTLTVDAESEALLRGSASLRVGVVDVTVDFEIRGWDEGVASDEFSAVSVVPPTVIVEPVAQTVLRHARAEMPPTPSLDDQRLQDDLMNQWLRQRGYLGGRRDQR